MLGFQSTLAWRARWERGDFPRRYDRLAQRVVDAERRRLWFLGEGIPGGATEIPESEEEE